MEGESDAQSAHWELGETEAKGMGTLERDVLADVGCDVRRVWE